MSDDPLRAALVRITELCKERRVGMVIDIERVAHAALGTAPPDRQQPAAVAATPGGNEVAGADPKPPGRRVYQINPFKKMDPR